MSKTPAAIDLVRDKILETKLGGLGILLSCNHLEMHGTPAAGNGVRRRPREKEVLWLMTFVIQISFGTQQKDALESWSDTLASWSLGVSLTDPLRLK